MRVCRRFLKLAGVAAVALPQSGRGLGAQVIRGSVVLPDSTTPLAGAIVAAGDRQAANAAQALTNARGEFTLRVPRPGRYGLRVLRIGYRPTIAPPVDVNERDTARVRIVFRGDAVVLATVSVRDKETCRVGADTGMMVARVWDEARKAVLSSQLTSDDAPLVADWVVYDRMLDSSGQTVRSQKVRSSTNPTTHAFHSLPAEALADKGYVISDNSGTTYYAPDADVLLSDSFASTHCFRLAAAPNDDHLIGVGFSPSRSRRGAPDIEGVLWIDRRTAELETLEFQYTNLPDVVRPAHPGGRVEFLRLGDGNWLVSRWSVRMPRVAAIDKYPGTGTRRVVMSASTQSLGGVQVTGGEVNRVMRRDTLVFRQAGPVVSLQVLSRDSLMSVAGARLTLEGTDYVAVADGRGRIDLTPVLAGRYRGRVATPLMDSLGMPAIEHEVEAANRAHVDSVFLPKARDALYAACPRDSVRNGEGMLHGRVRDERARPIVGAAVTATWQTDFAFVAGRESNVLEHREHALGAMTDANGLWRLCGVPREQTMAVRAATDSGSDAQKVRLELAQDFAGVDLVLHPRESSLAREAAVLSGLPERKTASLEIEVSRLGGDVLPDANLEVIAGGQVRRLITGPTGRALVPEIEPGRIVIRARHLGYSPGDVTVSVAPGRNMIPILMSSVATPMLDTVRVVAQSRLARLDRHSEFDERLRMHEASAAFTTEDIDKRGPVDAWQMLTNVPGVKIVDSLGVTAESTRGNRVTPDLKLVPCYMMVLVDGIEMHPSGNNLAFDLRQLPKPNEIHGIEVFDGPARVPVQYAGAGDNKWCGMIMVWTR